MKKIFLSYSLLLSEQFDVWTPWYCFYLCKKL